MDTEERLKILETEFRATRDELRQVLLDLRVYLMEAQSPFQAVQSATADNEPEKGVTPNGDG